MLIKIPVFILACFLFWPPVASAQGILVVQSLQIKPYDAALQGFQSLYDGTVKRLVTSEQEAADIVREVHRMKPALILAIGRDGLAKVRSVKDIPIVYLMVLNPQRLTAGNDNITGVSMQLPAEKQLAALQKVLPQVKKVGVLYDPAKSGAFFRDAQAAARTLGIELLTREVHEAKDALVALQGMKGKVGAFWMLPDASVVTPETVDMLLLSSIENNIPVFTFSEKYVEMGALLSLEIDPYDLGKQAGEMAKKVLAGTDVRDIPPVDARNAVVTINLKVARKLGIQVNSATNHKTRIIK